jgi:hypothetical protein
MTEFRVSEVSGTQGRRRHGLTFEILGAGSRVSRSAGMAMSTFDDSIR